MTVFSLGGDTRGWGFCSWVGGFLEGFIVFEIRTLGLGLVVELVLLVLS